MGSNVAFSKTYMPKGFGADFGEKCAVWRGRWCCTCVETLHAVDSFGATPIALKLAMGDHHARFRERATMSANNLMNGPRWSGRRALAARMLEAGASMTRVSAALGLSRATARRYETVFTAGGVDALLSLGDVGRQRRLNADDLERLVLCIRQAPACVGLAGDCWTNLLVQQFIEREFGISYSHSHINRLVRDHGLQRWLRQSQK
jgi:transposase